MTMDEVRVSHGHRGGTVGTAGEGDEEDARYMRRALQLALGGWGRVRPNPLVGAVLVRGSTVVGEGYHAEYGGPHAEVEAIRAAREAARGSTLYVNLEPCAHRGKTPPCTRAILDAGIGRVVFGFRDPTSAAAGGAETLERASVSITGGVLAEDSLRLNAPFFWNALRRGPFVALKLALSLDGRISAGRRRRTRISGPEAQAYVHRLRAQFDAIMVGGATALADDPRLTARGAAAPRRPALRVVLDTGLELREDSRLVHDVSEAPVLVCAAPDAVRRRGRALRERGVEVQAVEREPAGGLRLPDVLNVLSSRGVQSVLSEGGGRLGSALLRAGVVHRMHLLFSPILIGEQGVPGFPDLGPGAGGRWALAGRASLGEDTALELDNLEVLRLLREAA